MNDCRVPTCVKPREKRGYCAAHYRRWHKTGDVRAHVPLRVFGDLTKQLMSKIRVDGDGHWQWTGYINSVTGYGGVDVNGVCVGAHRAVWELHRGPIPADLTLDHLCRVRTCVNPDHMEPVTRAENTRREMAARRTA